MKTIVFDMYGVIIKDPHGGLMPYINRVFPGLDEQNVYSLWAAAASGEMPSPAFWRRIGDENPAKTEREYLDGVEIDEMFVPAAETLRKNFRLALLSNDISEWNRFLRGKFDLDRFFEAVVVSGDVGRRKPDPEIWKVLLEKLEAGADDCVFVDDRRSNLKPAAQMGMDVILFNSRAVPYEGKTVSGFDELLTLLTEKIKSRP